MPNAGRYPEQRHLFNLECHMSKWWKASIWPNKPVTDEDIRSGPEGGGAIMCRMLCQKYTGLKGTFHSSFSFLFFFFGGERHKSVQCQKVTVPSKYGQISLPFYLFFFFFLVATLVFPH